ncbi:hypothetical protein E4P82_19100 [Candidatus Competibacter phosphatis]|uniref:Uncharacterized protein n=1 Tax=Candidatus Competibacter phosphatis TaxID=221280 RepID=A0ABX1TNY8_9GAMM|nr:hypothetical protein [Candidatus Competibacter phosphatis]NMQ21116.1 hypothetical protein [Candidatus Competibacter phosphatis]
MSKSFPASSEVHILRDPVRAIFMAGVEAADPRKTAARVPRVQDRRLEIPLEPGSETLPVHSESWRRIPSGGHR